MTLVDKKPPGDGPKKAETSLPEGVIATVYFRNGVRYLFKEGELNVRLKDVWAAAQKVGER